MGVEKNENCRSEGLIFKEENEEMGGRRKY